MATEWVFKLRDQVSQPAASIESQLRRVATALKQLDIQSKQNQLARVVDPLKKARLELTLQRDKLLLSKRAMDEHASSTKKSAGEHENLRSSLVRFATSLYILDTFRRAFAAVGRAASGMADQIRDAVETQQRGLFGLRAQLGGPGGSSFFGQLEGQAQQFGRPPGEIVGLGQGFLQAGATQQNASAFVAAVQDIRARSGAAAAQQFQGAVQSMITSPQFSAGNLQAFAGVFPAQQLYQHFGRALGIRTDVEPIILQSLVDSVLNRREVSSARAQGIIQSLVTGLPGQRGRLGTLGGQFAAGTLEGSFGRVSTAWESLLASLASSRGVRTLQDVLQNIAKALGDRSLRQSLADLVNTLGDFLKPLTGPRGQEKIVAFFKSIAKTIKEEVVPPLAQLSGFIQALPDQVNTVATAMKTIGRQAATIVGSMLLISPSEESQKIGKQLLFHGLGMQDTTELDKLNADSAAAIERERARLSGASSARAPITLPPVHLHIDARGASSADAHAIGDAAEEGTHRALNTFLERLNTEQTGGVP